MLRKVTYIVLRLIVLWSHGQTDNHLSNRKRDVVSALVTEFDSYKEVQNIITLQMKVLQSCRNCFS